MIYFSTTTGGFYDSILHGSDIPADAVEITDADHASLLDAQAQGKQIVGDSTGHPVAVDPSSLLTLAQAQAAQIVAMYAAYSGAIAQDIDFTTAASVSKAYQADPQSVSNVRDMLAAYGSSGVPSGFYWIAKDNTQVPFTLADLQGLAKAMGDQGWAAFQQLQARKASILAATTASAVQAVTW